jgi:hypothetical protein
MRNSYLPLLSHVLSAIRLALCYKVTTIALQNTRIACYVQTAQNRQPKGQKINTRAFAIKAKEIFLEKNGDMIIFIIGILSFRLISWEQRLVWL